MSKRRVELTLGADQVIEIDLLAALHGLNRSQAAQRIITEGIDALDQKRSMR